MLIYQAENGGDNTAKVPLGGVISPNSPASSMAISIVNPITFYSGATSATQVVINQEGHSGDLYNYYWTSYSRGTDGANGNMNWHNAYLDGYIPLRVKSIYDPCPYLYRIPSHGTYSQFTSNPGWTNLSYLGGLSWNMNTLGESWFLGLGRRNPSLGLFENTGSIGFYRSSTASGQTYQYIMEFNFASELYPNRHNFVRSSGYSVRCIEVHGLTMKKRRKLAFYKEKYR